MKNQQDGRLTADIEGVKTTASAVSSKDIGRQHRTYKVSKMRDVVHVGQRTSDKDVALSRLGQHRGFGLLRFLDHYDSGLSVGEDRDRIDGEGGSKP